MCCNINHGVTSIVVGSFIFEWFKNQQFKKQVNY